MNPGERIGRYVIEASLGEGGMGTVYRAYDETLRRRVALKVLRSAAPQDQARRMLREARAAAALQHPNAAAVFDVGEEGGNAFIAMELVDGAPLRTRIADRSVTMAQKLSWLRGAARALGAAHERGLVHRDVKPENMLVTRGPLKLVDFGIAQQVEGDAFEPTSARGGTLDGDALATASRTLGTPRYMSPEQWMGLETTPLSDQFSWGLVAYELLVGVHPRDVPTALALPGGLPDEESLRAAAGDLAPEVLDTVMRTVSLSPAARFTSMQDVLVGLEPHGASEGRPLDLPSDERLRAAPSSKVELALASSVIERVERVERVAKPSEPPSPQLAASQPPPSPAHASRAPDKARSRVWGLAVALALGAVGVAVVLARGKAPVAASTAPAERPIVACEPEGRALAFPEMGEYVDPPSLVHTNGRTYLAAERKGRMGIMFGFAVDADWSDPWHAQFLVSPGDEPRSGEWYASSVGVLGTAPVAFMREGSAVSIRPFRKGLHQGEHGVHESDALVGMPTGMISNALLKRPSFVVGTFGDVAVAVAVGATTDPSGAETGEEARALLVRRTCPQALVVLEHVDQVPPPGGSVFTRASVAVTATEATIALVRRDAPSRVYRVPIDAARCSIKPGDSRAIDGELVDVIAAPDPIVVSKVSPTELGFQTEAPRATRVVAVGPFASRPGVVVTSGGVFATWLEEAGGESSVRAALVDPKSGRRGPVTTIARSPRVTNVATARTPDGAVVVYTSEKHMTLQQVVCGKRSARDASTR